MTDVAIYRSVEPVGGRIISDYVSGGTRFLEVRLDRAVDSVLRAEVNRVASPAVELFSPSLVGIAVPVQYEGVRSAQLAVVISAESAVSLRTTGVIPTSPGIGSRVEIIDAEAQALQSAVRALMMSPGTDVDEPLRGGGLRNLAGQLVNADDTSRLVRVAHTAVQRYNAYAAALNRRSRRGRLASGYRVVRVELLSLRVYTRAEAQQRLGIRTAATTSGFTASNYDPNDAVIAVSLGHDLRSPRGTTSRVSSAVAV